MAEGEVVVVVHEPVAHFLFIVANTQRVVSVVLAPCVIAGIGFLVV